MTVSPNREESIFNQAAELPVAERRAYLDQVCAGDAALRSRVEALLRAHDEAGDLLDAAPGSVVRTSLAGPSVEEVPGALIGRYKLLQKIGEGGCGVVYMAEQEEPVRRRVALKVIKLGMDTKEVIARFEAERQALALMDHSSIARVFDAGATEAGRPYFVMELVRGIPLTRYCDEHNLPTPARLGLFMQVCSAVQHAHQKGIIHRDLKPSNILVTVNDPAAAGCPKVIDFGIAKATQGRLTDRTLFTAFEQFIGTPAYMSPEQAELSSVDIDTRSDIYSLGVLLYELLTGQTPFDAKSLLQSGLDEIRRIIREVEPPKPSARLSTLTDADRATVAKLRSSAPALLSTLLRGDLDWIVMRCLEKDRKRRYETANGLALDIGRHLSNEPVIARPPSTAYLLQKLIRRHRLTFVAAAAVAAALLLGFGVSTWQYFKEKAARDRAVTAEQKARTEAKKSEQVAQFLKDMLEGVGPSVALGRDTTLLREILDKTADRVGRDLQDHPEAEAELRTTLGIVYQELAEFDKAEAMFRAALKLRQSSLGSDNPNVAASLLNLARILGQRGDLAGAELLFHAALATRRQLLAAGRAAITESNDPRLVASRAYNFQGDVEWIQRRLLAARRNPDANAPPDIAKPRDSLVGVSSLVGDLDEVESSLREALAMQHQSLGSEHPDIAKTLMSLGALSFSRGDYAGAEKIWREALAMQRKLLGAEHPDIAWQLMNLGAVSFVRRDYAGAATTWREALAMQRKLLPREHQDIAMSLDNLGAALAASGDPAGAEALLREASAMWRKLYGDHSPHVANSLGGLGEALQAQGKWAEAEAMHREALSIWEQGEPDNWHGFDTRSQLGASLAAQKKFAEAELLLLSGNEGLRAREGTIPSHERVKCLTQATTRLVQLYADWGQPEKTSTWQKKLDALDRASVLKPTEK